MERLDAALLAIAHFYSSARAFTAHMNARALSEVKRALFRALRIIRDTPAPVSISDVQQALGLSHPATSRLIERCVVEGFVDRSESKVDRRHMVLTLTREGLKAAREVEQARREVVAALVAEWPEGDVDALVRDLEKLGAEFERLREWPRPSTLLAADGGTSSPPKPRRLRRQE